MKNDIFAVIFGGMIAGFLGLAAAYQYELGLWIAVPVALFGGTLAWVFCDFAGCTRSVKTAWREVAEWQPDKTYWKGFALAGGAIFSFAVTVFFWVLFPFTSLIPPTEDFNYGVIIGIPLIISMLFGLIFGFIVAEGFTEEDRKLCKTVLVRWSIVTFPLLILWYGGKGMWWCIARVPFALKITGKFLWRAFVLAHSTRRRICFIGAALGTGSGLVFAYLNGMNTLTGALFCGVSNGLAFLVWREFVAVRWLGIKNA